ncbi:MAG: hypothetical protein COA78_03445 [Blastopirellula sp.]|nr:MAG: hypothetical protein COA78_03445 [Blastopirellula sp.]
MPFTLICDCGHCFNADDRYAGIELACPKCGDPVLVPKPEGFRKPFFSSSTPSSTPPAARTPASKSQPASIHGGRKQKRTRSTTQAARPQISHQSDAHKTKTIGIALGGTLIVVIVMGFLLALFASGGNDPPQASRSNRSTNQVEPRSDLSNQRSSTPNNAQPTVVGSETAINPFESDPEISISVKNTPDIQEEIIGGLKISPAPNVQGPTFPAGWSSIASDPKERIAAIQLQQGDASDMIWRPNQNSGALSWLINRPEIRKFGDLPRVKAPSFSTIGATHTENRPYPSKFPEVWQAWASPYSKVETLRPGRIHVFVDNNGDLIREYSPASNRENSSLFKFKLDPQYRSMWLNDLFYIYGNESENTTRYYEFEVRHKFQGVDAHDRLYSQTSSQWGFRWHYVRYFVVDDYLYIALISAHDKDRAYKFGRMFADSIQLIP